MLIATAIKAALQWNKESNRRGLAFIKSHPWMFAMHLGAYLAVSAGAVMFPWVVERSNYRPGHGTVWVLCLFWFLAYVGAGVNLVYQLNRKRKEI